MHLSVLTQTEKETRHGQNFKNRHGGGRRSKNSEGPVGDYAGLGGRAMTSAVVAKEVPPTCHPLGADNKLVIAPGMLSGTAAAMSGRISVGCKSPLTGGIKEANSGGQPSQVLARLGYAAIVLEGKPKDETFTRYSINKDGVKIEPGQQPEDARQL